ncbi:hypothetical protein EDD11_002202 [Mortierella claussenii]|nr:hypothetical protein EDD11_002202 [Mortierella claussenii]
MLSSHHGKSLNESTDLYIDNLDNSSTDNYTSKMGQDECLNSLDNTGRRPQSSPKKHLNPHNNKSLHGMEGCSPSIQSDNQAFKERLQHKDPYVSADLRLVDQNDFLNTALSPAIQSSIRLQPQQYLPHNSFLSSAQQQSSQSPHHARYTAGAEGDHFDSLLSKTPPTIRKVPRSLSSRTSLSSNMMSPPPRTGLVKSATTYSFYSTNDHLRGDTSMTSNNSDAASTIPSSLVDLEHQIAHATNRQQSSLASVSRRHSVSNNVHTSTNIKSNSGSNPLNVAIQTLSINNKAYLPSSADNAFHAQADDLDHNYLNCANQTSTSSTSSVDMSSLLPQAPIGTTFSSGVHPFDHTPTVSAADAWATGSMVTGMPPMPMSLLMTTASKPTSKSTSNVTSKSTSKSAAIQYLHQLQQSMMQQQHPGLHGMNLQVRSQQESNSQLPPVAHSSMPMSMECLTAGYSSKTASKPGQSGGQGSQPRRGSKTKVKRRVGSLPTTSSSNTVSTPSYMSAEMPWSTLSGHTQQMAVQTIFPAHQCSSIINGSTGMEDFNSSLVAAVAKQQQQQQQQQQSPSASLLSAPAPAPAPANTTRSYYHGPAPCGNPEPLYEYLASSTVVPGLEIIGHDYYGNYVQILPICPETTCSMNQDPVYLNLLQAIYAHTIPFLDLAPGSEEEAQRLMNNSPSAIATQSIQPPFKYLVPINGGSGGISVQNQSHSAAHSGRSTLTSSVSSPLIYQQQQLNSSSSGKLQRRASVPSISTSAGPLAGSASGINNRRHSTITNPSLSNPARKKKNAPRTHPYKATSVFKEDNPMVTEAILTQVGGIGGIGNSASMNATDPRHKVAEKMVHMDEAEYAAHYSKHQRFMNKSASGTALSLVHCMPVPTNSSLTSLRPTSLMTSSISAPSLNNASLSGGMSTVSSSPLDSIAAADFIRALSECNGGLNDLGIDANKPVCSSGAAASDAAASDSNHPTFVGNDLASLESLMMMDSSTVAAVQAAAATAWPAWFDITQLEKDVCQEGLTHQASAFTSASCSMAHLPSSNSTTLDPFKLSNLSREDNRDSTLLLSSSTDLAMMDDLLEDGYRQEKQQDSSAPGTSVATSHTNSGTDNSICSTTDSEMTLAVPTAPGSNNTHHHQNSTSQILLFDQYSAQSQTDNDTISSCTDTYSTTPSSVSDDSESSSASSELKRSISNDLSIPYTSSLLTVLPFSAQHSHPIFPTRGSRRSGWYRSKSVASPGLSEIAGVDYTTTCWYNVDQLQSVMRDSISLQESGRLKSLEDLTDPNPPQESAEAF